MSSARPPRPCKRSALTDVTPSWFCRIPSTSRNGCSRIVNRSPIEQIGPDDHVRNACLVLEREEHEPLRGPRALPRDDRCRPRGCGGRCARAADRPRATRRASPARTGASPSGGDRSSDACRHSRPPISLPRTWAAADSSASRDWGSRDWFGLRGLENSSPAGRTAFSTCHSASRRS